MTIVKQRFTITYEREVDTETGEILKTTIVENSKPVKQASIPDNDPIPKVILMDNKLQLNVSALKLINVNVGDRVDIRYIDNYPIIGRSELFDSTGTKVTKTGTISYRGKKSEELAKYGDTFELQPYDKDKFLLKGNKKIEKLTGDDNIDLSTDLNLDDFLDESETKASMFQL